MAGIEPASESFCHQTSTSLVSHFSFHAQLSRRRDLLNAIHLNPKVQLKQSPWIAVPHLDTSVAHLRSYRGKISGAAL